MASQYWWEMAPDSTPDDKRLFELLCKLGLEPSEAYTFVQELQDMEAANLIARFEAKLDALRWVIGIGFAELGILLAVLRVLG